MYAKLSWITENAELKIVDHARVSSTRKDKEAEPEQLLKFCIKHKHWSILEMASMCIEVETSRMVSGQILRHSFNVQEYSQRYSKAPGIEPIELRQAGKNSRDNSDDAFNPEFTPIKEIGLSVYSGNTLVKYIIRLITFSYNLLLSLGVSKETARQILPMATTTKMYLSANIRDWMFYLESRLDKHTQKEHRLLAEEIAKIFREQLPIISKLINI